MTSHWLCPYCKMRGITEWSFIKGKGDIGMGLYIESLVIYEHDQKSPNCARLQKRMGNKSIACIAWGPEPPTDDYTPEPLEKER